MIWRVYTPPILGSVKRSVEVLDSELLALLDELARQLEKAVQ